MRLVSADQTEAAAACLAEAIREVAPVELRIHLEGNLGAGKTTLLSVDPEYRSHKIGYHLQRRRQDYLKARGIRTLYTNSDDDRVVAWYLRHFGYEKTGKRIPKVESFGRDDRDEWINLKVEL